MTLVHNSVTYPPTKFTTSKIGFSWALPKTFPYTSRFLATSHPLAIWSSWGSRIIHSESHPYVYHTWVFSCPMSSNSLGRNWYSNFSWTLAMNCSWASYQSLSDISSGVNGLYVRTCPFCVRIFVVIAWSASILGQNHHAIWEWGSLITKHYPL